MRRTLLDEAETYLRPETHGIQLQELNLDQFTEKVLGYQNPPHIREWYQLLESGIERFNMILAPRGHAKSTCFSVNYPTWLLTYKPQTTIMLISLTSQLSEAWMTVVRYHLERLGRKSSVESTWTQRHLTVARPKPAADSSITALGAGAQIVGRHADIIIADDIVDLETTSTELQRFKTSQWFREVLLPCLNPGGRIYLIGTRWHYADLYSDMLASPDWFHKVDRAVAPDAQTVLWEDRFPLRELLEIKKRIGTILWNAQYQNDPSGMEGARFKHAWLHFYEPPLPVDLSVEWGVDLAISESPGADYFCCAELGFSPSTRHLYLLGYHREHLSFHGQLQYLLRRYSEVAQKPLRIIIESNAYQQALPQALQASEGLALPVIPRRTVKDKVTRLTALSAYFENETVLIDPHMQEFIEEWVTFDKGEHDDILDAVEFAVSDILDQEVGIKSYTPQIGFGKLNPPTPGTALPGEGGRPRFEFCPDCGKLTNTTSPGCKNPAHPKEAEK